MYNNLSDNLRSIIEEYNQLMNNIESEANISKDRAYGGIIRASKGKFVEKLATSMVVLAWKDLGRDLDRLTFDKETIKIPINKQYIERLRNTEVRSYIKDNIHKYYYPLKTDVHVHVDGKLIIVIECKAYTENAMLKRILVDFSLFKQVYPNLSFVLFQLESQLGGDFSSTTGIKYGSPSTHTLLSYFDIDLNIITLLEGERKVDQPIHKKYFYKPLKEENLLVSLDVLKSLLL